jgi:hypothetical protein
MLHSEQDSNDLEKSLINYLEDNNRTESDDHSEIFIITKKSFDWNNFYIGLSIFTGFVIIMIFVIIYFT